MCVLTPVRKAIHAVAAVAGPADITGTTVSAEDAQHVRHRVFCDRITPDRRRCLLRAEHRYGCLPEPP